MQMQKTTRTHAVVEGKGLFSGNNCRVRFCPAAEDTGVVFRRTDTVTPVDIPAEFKYLVSRPHRTTSLANQNVTVETVEHILAAVSGMDIDNIIIEIDSAEVPNIDGSATPFYNALQEAGIEDQDVPKDVYVLDEPVVVSEGETMLTALPGPVDCVELLYNLDYAAPSIGRQVFSFRLGKDDFAAQLAPARTFLLESEAKQFQAMGLGTHLTASDVLVMGDTGPVDNELRFTDEHVRHKMLDLIGDLSLLGRKFSGRVVAYRSGHEMNHALVQKLAEAIEKKEKGGIDGEPVMDIRRIMRLLPHRYPFLMVDRIISLDGDKKAVGIKNVTINEPFFQGHYPNLPIMPGVMIVEALAQMSGILLGRRLEHTGKVAVLLSMDKVKMRRPVRPGDQLRLEAESLHARSRTGHCKCRAYVGQEIACEAEIKFMLVDSEPM